MNIGLLLDPYGEKSPGGLGRAVFEMARGIRAADRKNSYVVYTKNAMGVTSLFLQGARKMDRNLDLYIFFNPIVPLFLFPKRAIVVVHDFAYLELPGRSLLQKINGAVLYCAHALSLRKATKIIAVSNTAKESTIRHFGTNPDKIKVIYNGFIALDGTPEPIPAPDNFFLFAGVLKERKNVAGIIKAFGLFARNNTTHELLIAGKQSGTYADSLVVLARELGMEKRVRFLGYVTDGQLKYLYNKAQALVFVSFIEGFGMPVLEAMHAGLPVIASNNGALAEVAGDAALLVNPSAPRDIAAAMSRIASDALLRADLKENGMLRARQFSWDENARQFIEIMSAL
ncbi:MAG: hypothetical protein A2843_01305 [Candidatus Wildermuthbacteria bacterium RIFCSPHIGHO2_01_FULL_48_27b]|uniref:Glycosyl transferase family 1 domain-containing protein n=1 Tax=Candidatus Wildermuthbacteria bacterium RIFCSPHIGHO2_01_FULL_48_27b TaxID=1802447 RepID=A0A1G2QWR9_9BACT|nr:MAG: Glycosyl transferase group 1 [Parcubacteria group bacterium GW2011_GWA2_50_10b]OHA65020.1 MAG: hypothetical protein A2843_01305 [Candidatus Wildermuthbacteria bacterium RIFCSPHIGHO2_01_FULL_48_27b]